MGNYFSSWNSIPDTNNVLPIINEYIESPNSVKKLFEFVNKSINRERSGKIMVIHGTGSNGKDTFIHKLSKVQGVTIANCSGFKNLTDQLILGNINNRKHNIVHIALGDHEELNVDEYTILAKLLAGVGVVHRNLYEQSKTSEFTFNILVSTNRLSDIPMIIDNTKVDTVEFTKTFKANTYNTFE